MLCSLVLVVSVMHFFKYITLVGFYTFDAIVLCCYIGWVLDMQMMFCIKFISLHVRMFIPCVNDHCGHYL